MAVIRTLAVSVTARTDKYKKNMRSASRSTKAFGSSVLGIKNMITGLATAGLVMLAKSVSGSIDATAKLASELGVAYESLVALKFAGDLAGVGQEELSASLRKSQKTLSDASLGLTTAQRAFDDMGLSVKDLGQMSPEEAFGAMLKGLNGVENQYDKTRIALDLFGRGGIKMIQLAKETGGSMEEIREALAKVGGALTTIETAKIQNMNDSFTRVKRTLAGLLEKTLAHFAPLIEKATTAFLDLVNNMIQGKGKMGAVFEILIKLGAKFLDIVNLIRVAWNKLKSVGTSLQKAWYETELAQMEWAKDSTQVTAQEYKKRYDIAKRALAIIEKDQASYEKSALDAANAFLSDLASNDAETLLRRLKTGYQNTGDAADNAGTKANAGMRAMQDAIRAAEEQMKKLESAAKRIFDETRTPIEKLEAELRTIQDVFGKGLIDSATFSRAIEAASERFRQERDQMTAGVTKQVGEFKQIDLRYVGLGGPATKQTQKVEDPQLKATNKLLSEIKARVGITGAVAQ